MRNKNFGGYKLEEIVGGGAYTKIYKARSFLAMPPYGNPAAIKLLYLKGNSLREKNKLVAQFEREAEIAMRLDHRNVVKVFNFGKFNRSYAIIMEYVDGKNLKEIIYEKEKFPLEKIIKISIEAGKGLAYIHKHNIVHKDVKPDNILVSHDLSVVKMTDFGIAKLPGKMWKKDIFPKGGTITKFGIISYMAPEQEKGKATFSSDIYSFGVALDELITAKLDIKSQNNQDYMGRIDRRAQRKHSGRQKILCEDLPVQGNLKNIIEKASHPDINFRYQNMEDLLNALYLLSE
jgi:eukaryotic-like serine/threonine-protein kinase